MTIDKSLRIRRGSVKARGVLKRGERITKLKEAERWEESMSVLGLPKVRVYKLTMKKKKKKKEEEGRRGSRRRSGRWCRRRSGRQGRRPCRRERRCPGEGRRAGQGRREEVEFRQALVFLRIRLKPRGWPTLGFF